MGLPELLRVFRLGFPLIHDELITVRYGLAAPSKPSVFDNKAKMVERLVAAEDHGFHPLGQEKNSKEANK